jgi:Tfp pilus assembly protein PilF
VLCPRAPDPNASAPRRFATSPILAALAHLSRLPGQYLRAIVLGLAFGYSPASAAIEADDWREAVARGLELRDTGRPGAAERQLRMALDMARQLPGPALRDVSTLIHLASVVSAGRRHAEAATLLEQALATVEDAKGPDDPLRAFILNNLGTAVFHQRDNPRAETLLRTALDIRKKALGLDHLLTAQTLTNLANVYSRQGEYARAGELHEQAGQILERVVGPNHPQRAVSLINLATTYVRAERFEEAEPLFERAMDIGAQTQDSTGVIDTFARFGLAGLYRKLSRFTEAEFLYRDGLESVEAKHGLQHDATRRFVDALTELYHAQGRDAEATRLKERYPLKP